MTLCPELKWETKDTSPEVDMFCLTFQKFIFVPGNCSCCTVCWNQKKCDTWHVIRLLESCQNTNEPTSCPGLHPRVWRVISLSWTIWVRSLSTLCWILSVMDIIFLSIQARFRSSQLKNMRKRQKSPAGGPLWAQELFRMNHSGNVFSEVTLFKDLPEVCRPMECWCKQRLVNWAPLRWKLFRIMRSQNAFFWVVLGSHWARTLQKIAFQGETTCLPWRNGMNKQTPKNETALCVCVCACVCLCVCVSTIIQHPSTSNNAQGGKHNNYPHEESSFYDSTVLIMIHYNSKPMVTDPLSNPSLTSYTFNLHETLTANRSFPLRTFIHCKTCRNYQFLRLLFWGKFDDVFPLLFHLLSLFSLDLGTAVLLDKKSAALQRNVSTKSPHVF